MPEELTRAQLEAMATPKLVELYNRLTGSQLKRLQSRSIGIERIIVELNKQNAVRTASGARTVQGEASVKMGRPPFDYSVEVSVLGQSTVRPSSMRGKILAFMKEHGGKARCSELVTQFGAQARGAVIKLLATGWLKRVQS